MNPQNFLNQICAVILPDGTSLIGQLVAEGPNFFINSNSVRVGFGPEAFSEIRPITVDPKINAVRAVFVIKNQNISNETSETNPERESPGT